MFVESLLRFFSAAALVITATSSVEAATSTIVTLAAAEGIAVTVEFAGKNSTYSVVVDGETWLDSAPVGLTSAGITLTSGPECGSACLALSGSSAPPAPSAGSDLLGPFEELSLSWTGGSGDSKVLMSTTFRAYKQIPVLVFEQSFPMGITDAAKGGNHDVSTAFPAWEMKGDLQGLTSNGQRAGVKGAFGTSSFGGGISGGSPLALFRGGGDKGIRSVVMSPLDNFVAGALSSPSKNFGAAGSDDEAHTKSSRVSAAGVLGSVKSIPAGFSHPTVLVGGHGIDSALLDWGDVLLKKGKKTRTDFLSHPTDRSLTELGYWTDNGAWCHLNISRQPYI